jgi:hypothetical protein
VRQPTPRHDRREHVGAEQAQDEQLGAAETGEPQRTVRGEEHELLEDDHLVRTGEVIAALRRALGGRHDELGEDRAAGEHHQPDREVGEEDVADHVRADRPEQGSRHAGDEHAHDDGRAQRGTPGLREEVRHTGRQPARHQHADQPGQHPEQREHAHAARTRDAGDHDGREPERDQREDACDHVGHEVAAVTAQRAEAVHGSRTSAMAAMRPKRAHTCRKCNTS